MAAPNALWTVSARCNFRYISPRLHRLHNEGKQQALVTLPTSTPHVIQQDTL
jgi:hypothetical protein